MRNFLATLTIVAVFVVGGYALTRGSGIQFEGWMPSLTASSAASFENIATEPAPPLGPTYTNEHFRFSLQMPEEYRVQEFEEDGVHTITIQDAAGNGLQILVTPFPDGDMDITSDMVRTDIPDMQIADVQEVAIGTGRKGIAFMSDNEAFGGASREVWFFFRGHLYQISTYARLDPLLQAMFVTWQFF